MSEINNTKQSYDDHVKQAMSEVKRGQHLRFINQLYKTKEVCLAAVRYESSHTTMLHDFYVVPMGNLDYVVEQMRELKKNDQYYIDGMERAYLERKEAESKEGYYGDFKCYQDMLDHYGVAAYDDMSRKRFDIMMNTTSV
ncbi:hypothetical protein QKU48_gp1415 [Fadolivirus algeromassiliense]|jgi:hypothetical protein|uniref:Uncharacterized protein n=1 Tax=Fadolivirus FV1/VV64 TaxID=3070911 RepID=A0A7D3URQ9_9VIRU|nr:hypothetical protein QKU48_gp1415 [Fadolivirus algeromassiliense]QKF94873.1 hypothetical protein Fadolivirus_1_1415 [Fadolivirus FV1/VV64]